MKLSPELVRAEIAALTRLAWPIVVARVGILALGLVDTLMVARLGAVELAAFGQGAMIAEMMVGPMVGLLLGISVVASRHYGAREHSATGAVWRQGLGLALLVGTAGMMLSWLAGPLFRLAGVEPALAEAAGRIAFLVGLSFPFLAVFLGTSFFLEAIDRPRPAMWVLLIGNGVNLLANTVLIFGLELGAEGCAIATIIVRVIMAGLLVGYVWTMKGRFRMAVRLRPRAGWWRGTRATRQAGYAAAGSEVFDAGGFSVLILMAGVLGTLAAAGFTLTINIYAVAIMVGFGVAGATLVRVGHARGAGDAAGMRRAGWVGLGFHGLVATCLALPMALFAQPLAALLTVDAALVAVTAPLIALCALLLLVDGTQIVAAHAARGAGDTWFPTAINAFCLAGIGVTTAWLLAFRAEIGVQGLFIGMVVALSCAMVGQGLRFAILTRRGAGS